MLFEEFSPSFVVAMVPSFYISPPQQLFIDVACIVGNVGSSQYVVVLLVLHQMLHSCNCGCL
jgi:hypothetical protein